MNEMTAASLKTLGERIKLARINRDFTQKQLADIIGRSRTAVEGAEKGKCTLETFVSLLVALDLTDSLDLFLPQQPISPISLSKAQGRQPKRASGKRRNKISIDQNDDLGW